MVVATKPGSANGANAANHTPSGCEATALWAIAGGVALFVGILVLQATLAFWTVESLEVANVLTYGGVQAAQYPLNIYAAWFRRLLTFGVPLACVAYYPVLAVHGLEDLGHKLNRLAREGKWSEMAKEVPDDVGGAFGRLDHNLDVAPRRSE